MRKFLSLLLVLALVAFSACAQQPSPADSTPPSAEPTPADSPADPSTEPSDAPQDTAANALASLSGNQNNMGYVVQTEDHLFVGDNDGLWRMDADGQNKIKLADESVQMLQINGDRLFYLAAKYAAGDFGERTVVSGKQPFSMKLDGSDKKELGPFVDYSADDQHYTFSDDNQARHTVYYPYKNFTVYGEKIYYISNNAKPATYEATMQAEGLGDETVTVNIDSNLSLYCMDLDGGNVSELVADLGNGFPSIAFDEGLIYYTTDYLNPFYAYNFVTYNVYNIETGESTPIFGHEKDENSQWNYSSEMGHCMDIPYGIQCHDGAIYASLGDSEGDFRDSRLVKYTSAGATPVLDEIGYNKSVLTETGIVYMGGTRDDETNDLTSLGIFFQPYDGQPATQLLKFEHFSGFPACELFVQGDYVYAHMENMSLLRIPLSGDGQTQALEESGFAAYDEAKLFAWVDAAAAVLQDPQYLFDDDFEDQKVLSYFLLNQESGTPLLFVRSKTAYDVYSLENAQANLLGSLEGVREFARQYGSNTLYAISAPDEDAMQVFIVGTENGTVSTELVLEGDPGDDAFTQKLNALFADCAEIFDSYLMQDDIATVDYADMCYAFA